MLNTYHFQHTFCRQRRYSNTEPDVNVDYGDICNYELHSVDRRAAINIPNLFFMKQVLDKVTLAIHRHKTKGKRLQAMDILDYSEMNN